MISGDKDDEMSAESISSKDYLDNLRTTKSSTNFDEQTKSIDNASSDRHVKSEEFVTKRNLNQNPIIIDNSKTVEIISNIEINVTEVLLRLENIQQQFKMIKNTVDLKNNKSIDLLNSTNNFDKYVTYATSILNKMLIKFKKQLIPRKDVSVSKVSNSLSNYYSFVSFLKIGHIHELVNGMTVIGHGGEGRVYRAFLINSGDPVVVKSYFMDCEQSSRIEYAMLVLCNNIRGVKRPIGLFQTSTNYYLLMEDDHKSIPLDVLAEKGILTESQIQHLFSQMVYILYDLRNKFIKHRDVKLDNFLLNTETGRLSIIDFGWAMYTALDQVMIEEVIRSGETLMGTNDYLPPEADSPQGTVVSYDKATVYALGCILLELFFGYQGKVRFILAKESIQEYVNRMSISKFREVSKGAVSVLDRCLRTNIKERLNLEEVTLHPWVPSDKVDNSVFRNIKNSKWNPGISSNTSTPCSLTRSFSVCSQ